MSRDSKWEEWKYTYTEETMKMFHNFNETDLVTGTEEVVQEQKTPM